MLDRTVSPPVSKGGGNPSASLHRFEVASIDLRNRALRSIWNIVWLLLFRPSPRIFHGWRVALLRLFGAQIASPAYIYPSARVWAPWNLSMQAHSTLADGVNCYCVDKIMIGAYTTVSQYTHLCTATHDYSAPLRPDHPEMPLLTAPIRLGDRVWVTADVFVAPGVHIGDGGVALARSVVLSDIQPWTVVSGNPAVYRKTRTIRA